MTDVGWPTQRAIFQERLDALSAKNVNGLLSDLNTAIANYTPKTDGSKDPAYTKIQGLIATLTDIKNKYDTLISDINNYVSEITNTTDINKIVNDTGYAQIEIKRLEDINEKLDDDIETARARDELLRSRNTKRTSHMLFLTDRPIRKQTIPVLWLVSVIFIGIALILIRSVTDSIQIPNTILGYFLYTIIDIFQNPVILRTLLGASIIVIIFLSLKIARVI
jgi:hypothetical protein